MVKHRLSQAEVEVVRVAMLAYMQAENLSAAAVAHLVPSLRQDALRKFLAGTRRSSRIAGLLVARFPLGLRYTPPAIERDTPSCGRDVG